MSLVERLQRAQLRLAATALFVMMGATVLDVALRYALNRPLRFSYDLVESMLVIYVFHGMAAAFLRRRNIVIDIVDSVVGARVVGMLTVLADIVSILCLAVFAYAMIQPASQAFQYGDRKIELGLPLYALWLFALAGIAGTLLAAGAAFVGQWRGRKGKAS
jgi:TRAP-type C4-dicarboxylate transport system permease small subunit